MAVTMIHEIQDHIYQPHRQKITCRISTIYVWYLNKICVNSYNYYNMNISLGYVLNDKYKIRFYLSV